MIKIRLSRVGKKNRPFYRIVAIDSRNKRSGRALEILGHWDPIKNDLKIDRAMVKKWTDKGAQLTKAVVDLLK